MTKKRWPLYSGIFIIAIAVIIFTRTINKPSANALQEVTPAIGSIQTVITATATVQPQNRLEIKPSINGRIDQILVHEGEDVKMGQVLALMSSTERAALLDAAKSHSPDEVKYW